MNSNFFLTQNHFLLLTTAVKAVTQRSDRYVEKDNNQLPSSGASAGQDGFLHDAPTLYAYPNYIFISSSPISISIIHLPINIKHKQYQPFHYSLFIRHKSYMVTSPSIGALTPSIFSSLVLSCLSQLPNLSRDPPVK